MIDSCLSVCNIYQSLVYRSTEFYSKVCLTVVDTDSF